MTKSKRTLQPERRQHAMPNKIPNRQAICDVLCTLAAKDKDIVVLCSDSRGSASMTRFAKEFPAQFV